MNWRTIQPAVSRTRYTGPEPALPMPYNAVKTAIRQWAYVQANNRWQNIKTCRQAKLIIQGHSSSRTRELLRLRRQKLRLATGILTGHSQLNRHLSVMGIISDPTCNYCKEELDTAAHFLRECRHFVTQRQEIWGKSYLHPSEADSVQNLVRFILKSHRFS